MARKKSPVRLHKRTSKAKAKPPSAPALPDRGVIHPGEPSSDPVVVERRELGGVIYQLEWVTCGKPRCACAANNPFRVRRIKHGPYWYAYRLAYRGGGEATSRGRWVSKYIGKVFAEI